MQTPFVQRIKTAACEMTAIRLVHTLKRRAIRRLTMTRRLKRGTGPYTVSSLSWHSTPQREAVTANSVQLRKKIKKALPCTTVGPAYLTCADLLQPLPFSWFLSAIPSTTAAIDNGNGANFGLSLPPGGPHMLAAR